MVLLSIDHVALNSLIVPASDTDVSADPYTAALLCDLTTEHRAFGETWELLCAEDKEGYGLDLQTEMNVGAWCHSTAAQFLRTAGRFVVTILVLLYILEETEA